MHLKFKDINDAFGKLIYAIANRTIHTERKSSRGGEVLQIPEPVLLEYENSTERVLFNQARDANPFFHVMEALWMLAGRNDVASLAYFASNVTNYSDDGKTFNGAYGYRWRHANVSMDWGQTTNQIQFIIDELKRDPTSRRCVLQMWNVEDDLLKISKGENYSKDVCCNLSVMFSIRKEFFTCDDSTDPAAKLPQEERFYNYLDMTVTNRSNDLVWGCLGANYVHFSFLQEYMANCIGVGVGKYYQFTNNLHVYTDGNSKFEENAAKWLDWYVQQSTTNQDNPPTRFDKIPLLEDVRIESPNVFDQEVGMFVDYNYPGRIMDSDLTQHTRWETPFLCLVAQPMMHAFHMHKNRNYGAAMQWCARIEQDDWRWVATKWIEKRRINWEQKKGVE